MSCLIVPWRVLSSHVVVSDSWLTLQAQTCETADGVRIDPFYLISAADVVAVVAITRSSELILVRQYRHGYGGATLEIPAGRIDPDEDPVAAGLRELREETGYTSQKARLIRAASPNTLRNTNRLYIVLAEEADRAVDPVNDPLERIETTLWPVIDADALLLSDDFANAPLIGALAATLADIRQSRPVSS